MSACSGNVWGTLIFVKLIGAWRSKHIQLFLMKDELRRLIVVRLLLWKRAKTQKNIKALQQLVKAYVSASGGWKRAFPSDICGDVYVNTSFNIAAEQPCWISENLRLPVADIDRTRRGLGIPELVNSL